MCIKYIYMHISSTRNPCIIYMYIFMNTFLELPDRSKH